MTAFGRSLKGKTKALRTLGFRKCFYYGRYLTGLKSGWLALRDRASVRRLATVNGNAPFIALKGGRTSTVLTRGTEIYDPALTIPNEIVAGKYRPYSVPGTEREPVPLVFRPLFPDLHWSKIHVPDDVDVKDFWEPARFGWASELARAFTIRHSPVYVQTYVALCERFWKENPPNFGVQAVSGQEVALRLIQIVYAESVFRAETDGPAGDRLAKMIQASADRILLTLDYARAQNNNHWLSEAAGLMTAAVVFPELRNRERVFSTGWREFRTALQRQILPDGEYIQYSANYHRLALQLILWVNFLLQQRNMTWPPELIHRIQRTVRKFASRVDSASGRATNYGHNDGANLFAFGAGYWDYRPTLQGVSRVFLGKPYFPPGPWDELGDRFNALPLIVATEDETFRASYLSGTNLRLNAETGWASVNISEYRDRPAHADQLHTVIWQAGDAIVLDPGTFRYNGISAMNNRLKSAFVHNGVTVDDCEPMTDAGKFLWLDWNSGRILANESDRVSAEHFGYRRIGVTTVREVERNPQGWTVIDRIGAMGSNPELRLLRLNWTVPDGVFECRVGADGIVIETERFVLRLSATATNLRSVGVTVVRDGVVVREIGAPVMVRADLVPILGRVSPLYSVMKPALSFVLSVQAGGDVRLCSHWIMKTPTIKDGTNIGEDVGDEA